MKKLLALMLLLPGVVMAQPYPKNSVPERSIRSFYGALGGTNDDTAKFQTALNSGVPTWVDPTTNYSVTPLIYTNGSTLIGVNSHITFISSQPRGTNIVSSSAVYGSAGSFGAPTNMVAVVPGQLYYVPEGLTANQFVINGTEVSANFASGLFSAVGNILVIGDADRSPGNSVTVRVYSSGTNYNGAMFSGGTNLHDVHFEGLVVDGQGFGSSSDVTGFIPTYTGTNARSAFVMNAFYADSSIINVRATNFSDAGFRFAGGAGATPQPTWAAVTFANCQANNCFIGLQFTNNAEYMHPIDFDGAGCIYGIRIESGNTFVTGGKLTKNTVAVAVLPASNGAHGSCSGITMNHNGYAITCDNFNNGFNFTGCNIEGGGVVSIRNCAGFNFQRGVLGASSVIIDGGSGSTAGQNYMEGNGYFAAMPPITLTNSGVVTIRDNYNIATGSDSTTTNSAINRLTNSANQFTGTIIVPGTGGVTLATNSTAPGNTTTIRAWYTVTNNTGGVFKAPLYQ